MIWKILEFGGASMMGFSCGLFFGWKGLLLSLGIIAFVNGVVNRK